MKSFLFRFIVSLAPLLLGSLVTHSQQPLFEEQTQPAGVTRIRNVVGMMADSNNCIWLATQSGIYRYDGFKFRHYSDQNTATLQYERMAGIATILRGDDKALCIQDAQGNLYTVNKESRIEPLNEGKNTKVAFGTVSRPFHFFSRNQPENKWYADKIQTTFFVSSSKTFYLRLEDRVIEKISATDLYNLKKGDRVYSWNNGDNPTLFATENHFYTISNNRIQQLNDTSGKPTPVYFTGDLSGIERVNNTGRLDILQSSDKKFSFAWHGNKLYEINETKGSNLLHTKLMAETPEKDVPLQVLYSQQQHLLVIYYKTRGLVFYRPRQFSLLSYKQTDQDVSDNYYYSFFPYRNGFVTVINEGLVWLGINGRTELLAKDASLKFFLFKDDDDNIWYQATSLDIKRYNPKSGKSETIITAAQTRAFSNKRFDVKSMVRKDSNSYYLLTQFSLIELSLQYGTPVLKALLKAPDKSDFSILFVKDAQTLQLGTSNGLIEYNTANGTHKTVPRLTKAFIRAVTKIGENNYLVGTYNKGIFQEKNGKWWHLSSRLNNLPPSAHAFITDSLTRSVWVSSNDGLLRLSLAQLQNNTPADSNSMGVQHFMNFGPSIMSEFNGSNSAASAKLSDTTLAFANVNGLVTFNPLNIVSYPLPTNALMESVNETDNDSIPVYNNKLELVEVSPVIPYFGNLEELEVSYFLTNYDKQWHLQAPGSVIIYRKLPPGEHTLQFRIRHTHDFPGKELVLNAASLYIPYKWYQKTGYQLVLATMLLLILFMIHSLRIWFIKKRKKELEQQVKLKTAELSESNENLTAVIHELTTSEAKLKKSNFLKDEYYALLTHDLRSPLKFLSFNLGHLLEKMPDMDEDMLKKGIITTYQSSNELNKLVDEFVYWIQENEKEIKIHPEQTSVAVIVSELKKLFAIGMETNENVFISEVQDNLHFFIDANILFMILRNAVDNANKYTSAGEIRLTASCNNNDLQICVADTGMGISAEMVEHLMRIQDTDIPLSSHQKKSLGFYIMAMLLRKLKGCYRIESTKGKGTSIIFTIPECERPDNQKQTDAGKIHRRSTR
ncbi:ATP-binding protein [Danxiaibacter flavus]|uniref:ATP-binding protein n=1 Tax=Danxiaibacter flavus TaxID=3049108 RepID=A0ABV3ZI78_9BACT|nr:ATP-binding protein [Chitinophagaceae bacterium DXS]